MRVGKESLEALQIVHANEIHPNANFSHSPNRLSIGRLLEHNCKTVGGRELLKGWIARPLTGPEELETKWNMIDSLLKINDGKMINDLQQVLSGGRGLRIVDTTNFNHRKASALINLIKSSIMVKSILNDTLMNLDFDVNQLRELQNVLEQVVNLKESNAKDRLVISNNVHPRLDQLRDIFDNLEEILVPIRIIFLFIYIVRGCKGDRTGNTACEQA